MTQISKNILEQERRKKVKKRVNGSYFGLVFGRKAGRQKGREGRKAGVGKAKGICITEKSKGNEIMETPTPH